MPYVDSDTIRAFAEAPDADETPVWDVLAASASLIFDRACGVAENFFAKASDAFSNKTFAVDPTGFVYLPPYVEIESVTLSGLLAEDRILTTAEYELRDDFLILASENYFQLNFNMFPRRSLTASAKWGFPDIPADVKQAVIEQALFMWRKKDIAFTEISGVSTAAVQQQLSTTCQFVANNYKEKYLDIGV